MKGLLILLIPSLIPFIFLCTTLSRLSAQDDAALNIEATDQGVLVPRISLTGTNDVATILSPTTSLLVYNTATVNDIVPGFYYWDGVQWVPIGGQSGSGGRYLGELWGGGIIFFIDESGEHGLIASLADLGDVPWGMENTDVPGCESLFDGAANTADLIAAGADPWDPAGLCDAYSAGGFTDWYLPSQRELYQLNSQDVLIDQILDNDSNPATQGFNQEDGFPNLGAYWSSSENATTSAWYVSFSQGYNAKRSKTNSGKVRAIRAF